MHWITRCDWAYWIWAFPKYVHGTIHSFGVAVVVIPWKLHSAYLSSIDTLNSFRKLAETNISFEIVVAIRSDSFPWYPSELRLLQANIFRQITPIATTTCTSYWPSIFIFHMPCPWRFGATLSSSKEDWTFPFNLTEFKSLSLYSWWLSISNTFRFEFFCLLRIPSFRASYF